MNVDISAINRILRKLKKKDPIAFKVLQNKINQIAFCNENSIQHFKNLKHDSKDYKRVHLGHFVLVFRVKEDIVIFEDYGHHDDIYNKY